MFSLIKKEKKRIQAKKQKIGTYEIDKISLSCFDNKRFVLDDGINTLLYFHKDCNKKDCDNIKDCDNKKDYSQWKKICDNKKNQLQ